MLRSRATPRLRLVGQGLRSVTQISEEARRSGICAGLQRFVGSVQLSSQAQFEQAKFWRGAHPLFGVPAAILAVIGIGGYDVPLPGDWGLR